MLKFTVNHVLVHPVCLLNVVLLQYACFYLLCQEVIEFPVLKVDARSFNVVAKFHMYVQPKVNKTLTHFCTQVCALSMSLLKSF